MPLTQRLDSKLLAAWLLLVVVGVVSWLVGIQMRSSEPLAFNGNSDQLRDTVVLPTLDLPIPEGKSAIWCVSFQLAWNRLRDDLAKEPVRVENAQPLADRLNAAVHSEDDLDPNDVYAAAGFGKDGIAQRIRDEMQRKFPNQPPPELDVDPSGAVAYAFLTLRLRFDPAFAENDRPLTFTDSKGKKTSVQSFGVLRNGQPREALRQIEVLYRDEEGLRGGGDSEFVLDLARNLEPYQIVVARIERKATLAEMLKDVQEKVNRFKESKPGPSPIEMLLVPNMAWKVEHSFADLTGSDKRLLNPNLADRYLAKARQNISFRLDHRGVELTSEAEIDVKKSKPMRLVFDQPFLLYLKKRNSPRPFFAIWIDNAELLQGW
jgi:hypothetical protein